MNTIDDLKCKQNYDMLQKIFMNIRFMDYLDYIFQHMENIDSPSETRTFLRRMSDCDANYLHDFKEAHMGPDSTMTVGQLLSIAVKMFPDISNSYPPEEQQEALEAGIRIVETLILMPFVSIFALDKADEESVSKDFDPDELLYELIMDDPLENEETTGGNDDDE